MPLHMARSFCGEVFVIRIDVHIRAVEFTYGFWLDVSCVLSYCVRACSSTRAYGLYNNVGLCLRVCPAGFTFLLTHSSLYFHGVPFFCFTVLEHRLAILAITLRAE